MQHPNHLNNSDKYMVKNNKKDIVLFTTFNQTKLTINETTELCKLLELAVKEHTALQ
jgi:hypothetical protein